LLGEVQVRAFNLDGNCLSVQEGPIRGTRLMRERYAGHRSATIAVQQ
jgi:hypothetical protein